MTPLFARPQASERAFERLYQAHVLDIYRYALMVTRNPDDAEDVVQTTFMKAFRAFQNGEKPRNPRHWLIRIAHNTCRTRFRDAKRRPQEVTLDDSVLAAAEPQDDGVGPAELLRALGDLRFNQRAALVMRELEGRSYAEIAEVLELSPSAVETLIFRARRALREQLDGALRCGEAELALSRDLDGRLDRAERAQLRAHLRACRDCAGLARRQRARRAALAAFGPVPLPASLASWGGGAAVGTGIAAKVAAVVAAGATAAGVSYEAAEAVREPAAHDRAPVVARAPAATPARFAPAAVTPPLATEKTDVVRKRVRAAASRAKAVSALSPAATPSSAPAPAPAPSAQAPSAQAPSVSVVPQVPVQPKLPVEPPAVPAPALPPTPPLPVEPPSLPPPPEVPPLPPVLP